MTDQKWAEPEGFKKAIPIVSYHILDRPSGKVVERTTEYAYDTGKAAYFLSLAAADQAFSYEYSALVQKACAYFYKREGYEPLTGWEDARVSDEEVAARIRRINEGENTREADRVSARKFPLDQLPWDQQRALIERIDELKRAWSFEIIGETGTVEPASHGITDYLVD